MDVTKKLASAGYLSKKQMKDAEDRAEAFLKVARKNPKLLEQAMEKLGLNPFSGMWSGFKSVFSKPETAEEIAALAARVKGSPISHAIGSSLGQILPGTLAAAAVTGGLAAGTDLGRSAVGGLKDKIQKARDFKVMMEANPNLAEYDSTQVQRAFNTLHRFSPEHAADPMVAGTFVATTVDQERMDVGTINNIIKARREMSQGKDRGSADFFAGMMPKAPLFEGYGPDQELELKRNQDVRQQAQAERQAALHPHELALAKGRAETFPGEQARSRAEYKMRMRKSVPELTLAQAKADYQPDVLKAESEFKPDILMYQAQGAPFQAEEAEEKRNRASEEHAMAVIRREEAEERADYERKQREAQGSKKP